MKKIAFLFLTLALCALIFTACDGDPAETTTVTTTSPTTTAPVTTATPAAFFEYRAYREDTEIWITKYNGTDKEVVIPSMIDGKPVTIVGGFWESDVEKVWIPDSVEQIDSLAFQNCKALTEIVFGSSLKAIQRSAFEGCTSLKSITLPQQLINMQGDVFLNCTALEAITIPKTLTHYYENFGGCTSLKTVTFEEGTKHLALPLAGTPVEEIVIGAGVETINQSFFLGCRSLKTVTFLGDAPTVNAQLEGPYPTNPPEGYTVTIYYPQNAMGWDSFPVSECYRLVPQ